MLEFIIGLSRKFSAHHFYRAAWNEQTRSSDENVCLSVAQSVKRVNCDKTKEKSVLIFIPLERSFMLVF